jgi:ABC-type uncharacterized transport system YnjBCD ATPase subunit
MSTQLSVHLDAVDALADELTALADQLAEDPPLCRAAATSYATALGGEAGRRASDAAIAWAGLTSVLADRCAATAGALRAAVASYRALDDGLATVLSPGGLAARPR